MQQPPPNNYLEILNQFIADPSTVPLANEKIKQWGLKVEIRNGQLIDMSDTTEAWLCRFITTNQQMLTVKEEVRKLAKIDDEVLISGPTGTGKELIAHALHGSRQGRFVAVNCAGLPETLIESILFGHMKGSFTGASETRDGLVTVAEDGTLFLDEIGEFPLSVQAKLLRAIQERKIMKLGSSKDEDVLCRIVAATHRDIPKMVREELFRQDLYARVSTFELHLTPLIARKEDISAIINSLEGGKQFIEAAIAANIHPYNDIDTNLNVRSLQQHVKRFSVLGKLPSKK